jgi:hypothetical protein
MTLGINCGGPAIEGLAAVIGTLLLTEIEVERTAITDRGEERL